MKTLTLSEFERELKNLFAAVKNGEHVVVTRGDEQIEVVPDRQTDMSADLGKDSAYTPSQRLALELGWSPATVATLEELDSAADDQPDPFPRIQDRPSRKSVFDEDA